MAKTSKVLIIDDDPELRDALTEQLSLHEEFQTVAVENGSKGVQAAKAGQIDPGHHGCGITGHRRPRGAVRLAVLF